MKWWLVTFRLWQCFSLEIVRTLQNLSTSSSLQLGKRHFSPVGKELGTKRMRFENCENLPSFIFLPQAYLEPKGKPLLSFCKPIKAWRNANCMFGWNSCHPFHAQLLIIIVFRIYEVGRSGTGVGHHNNNTLWSFGTLVTKTKNSISRFFFNSVIGEQTVIIKKGTFTARLREAPFNLSPPPCGHCTPMWALRSDWLLQT